MLIDLHSKQICLIECLCYSIECIRPGGYRELVKKENITMPRLQKSIPSPGAPSGNQNAVKDDADKLGDSRTFRFKASELKAYNKAKPSWMPLRLWVRKVLNEAAGHAPPDRERFTMVITGEDYMFKLRLEQLLGVLVRIDCSHDLNSEPEIIENKAILKLNSLREQSEIRSQLALACKTGDFEIESLNFRD